MADRHAIFQIAEQFTELLWKIVGVSLAAVALQREGRRMIGARSAADAEIDAAGKQCAQDAEVLGNLKRAIVRQHNAAASDPHAVRNRTDRRDHDLRTGAGQHGAAVMLRHPVTRKSEFFREAREVERIAQGVGAGGAFRDWGLIENADIHQAATVMID